MSCESCKNCKKGVYRDAFGSYPKYKYCPMCGEALTEPRPLTLDELRERDGMPVWVESKADALGVFSARKHWCFVSVTGDGSVDVYPCNIHEVNEWNYYYGIDHDGQWLAYDRPPKEGANG